MIFSPWNGVLEHRPLGSLQRLRARVYTRIATKRTLENGVESRQPDGSEATFAPLK